MYIVNLISATLGVWFCAKVFGDLVLAPVVGKENVLAAGLKPPYPLHIAVGIVTGYVSRFRWKGSHALWVWVPPAIYLAAGIVVWLQAGFHIGDSLNHFFGLDCYPLCHDQYERTVPLYSTVAYALGALAHRKRGPLDREAHSILESSTELERRTR
jgi:hypothetical protein